MLKTIMGFHSIFNVYTRTRSDAGGRKTILEYQFIRQFLRACLRVVRAGVKRCREEGGHIVVVGGGGKAYLELGVRAW